MKDSKTKASTNSAKAEKVKLVYVPTPKAKGLFERVGDLRIKKAKAKKMVLEGKADLVKAKQGATKIKSIGTAAVGVAAALSGGRNSANASKALAEWASAINSTPSAAEGTGEGSNPSATGEGQTGTTGQNQDPIGNYKYDPSR